MFNLSGIVKVKKDTEQVTDTFRKREFVVTDASGNYPQDILFQLTQDRVNLIDNINEGDLVSVTFNIRGREWKSPQGEMKYFVSLDAWRLEKTEVNSAPPVPGMEPIKNDDVETLIDESDDDLPF